jgi:hypothetical protein
MGKEHNKLVKATVVKAPQAGGSVAPVASDTKTSQSGGQKGGKK